MKNDGLTVEQLEKRDSARKRLGTFQENPKAIGKMPLSESIVSYHHPMVQLISSPVTDLFISYSSSIVVLLI